MNTSTPPPEVSAEDKNRWAALYTLCAGFMMIVLDITVVNVALPEIQLDLNFTQSGLAWVVNAYLIAFGGFLLLAGRLGDLIGRRSIFLAGLTVFTISSIFCGLAQDGTWLVVARFAQGIGGAMTSAVALGMIVTLFPEPREQAKAIGVFAFVASAGGAVGLVVGGALTQTISWHWSFFVNAPIGLITGYLTSRYVKKDSGIGFAQGADALGAFLITSTLMLSVYTIVSPAAERGWGDSRTTTLAALCVALFVAFIIRESKAAHPLMPLRIFKSRNIAGANLIQVCGAAGMFGISFMGALYVQRILGYDALETGLAFLPMTICMGVLSVKYSEPLITRFGARPVVLVGLTLVAFALLLFTNAPVNGNYFAHVFPVVSIMGLGAGLAFPPLMGFAMSGVEPKDAGLASGLVNTTAQIGGALGLAVFATLASSRTNNDIAKGVEQLAALNNGYHLAYVLAAGMVTVAFIITATVLKKPEPMKIPEGMEAPVVEPIAV